MSELDNKFTHQDSVTLKEYFESKFKAVDKALKLASSNMERRLEGMNEFREDLRNQAATFVSRTECEAHRKLIDADLRMLRESKSHLEGKASQLSVTISLLLALAGLVVAVGALIVASL